MTPFLLNMGYKTVYIQDSDKLQLYLDNLVVYTNQGEIRFLISDLKILIIDNYKTVFSTQLITKLAENNVAVVICNLSHMPFTQLIPLNGHHASSLMINKQISWNPLIKKIMHQRIVQEKIQSQIEILKKNDRSISVIDRMCLFKKEVMLDDSTNCEGLAAKMYFKELFGKNFIRFEDDIVNAGLNYGYSIFRSLIASVIVSKGLLLNLGIFHHGPMNQSNLADDIIEIFRPIVDDYVFNHLLNAEFLTLDHRKNLIKLLDLKIEFKGQMNSILHCIEMYLESIIRCFELENIDFFQAPSLSRIYDI